MFPGDSWQKFECVSWKTDTGLAHDSAHLLVELCLSVEVSSMHFSLSKVAKLDGAQLVLFMHFDSDYVGRVQPVEGESLI